jgi:hypothetical protein
MCPLDEATLTEVSALVYNHNSCLGKLSLPQVTLTCPDHRVHRVVTAAFWRKFHHEGKISLAGKGAGARPPPFTTTTITSEFAVYAPAEWADTLTLFHLYQYIYSMVPTDRPYQVLHARPRQSRPNLSRHNVSPTHPFRDELYRETSSMEQIIQGRHRLRKKHWGHRGRGRINSTSWKSYRIKPAALDTAKPILSNI